MSEPSKEELDILQASEYLAGVPGHSQRGVSKRTQRRTSVSFARMRDSLTISECHSEQTICEWNDRALILLFLQPISKGMNRLVSGVGGVRN